MISRNNVWADGSYITGNNAAQTLVEHWDGTKWSIVPSPDPQEPDTPPTCMASRLSNGPTSSPPVRS
ncbi:MAG TPA: hypothetical protein VN767_10070 [Streptosporangiaceae bacterium]|nr:hypothetical protein [Streptosporangiaceae bacterium]